MFEEKELLTVKETAELLGVCEKTIYKLINNRTIFVLKVGKNLRVVKSKLIDSLGTK
ncbi:MAG: helix-turn-helix domain-containing protein [Clostridia bacterium]|nr:helix-turn-helix domain-containing protein [Clostridia bacterium]